MFIRLFAHVTAGPVSFEARQRRRARRESIGARIPCRIVAEVADERLSTSVWERYLTTVVVFNVFR